MCPVKIASTFGRLVSWSPRGARWVMGNSVAPVSVKIETEQSHKVCSYGAETVQNRESTLKWTSGSDSSSPSTNLYWSPSELIITVTLFGITWAQTQGRKWPAAGWWLPKSDTISLVDATLGINCLTALPAKLGEKQFLWASQKITLTVALNDLDVFLGCDF